MLGRADGAPLGIGEGSCVGSKVGIDVGAFDMGDDVGSFDGVSDGNADCVMGGSDVVGAEKIDVP